MMTDRLELEAVERRVEQLESQLDNWVVSFDTRLIGLEKRIEVLEEQYASHYHHVQQVAGYQTTTNPITIGYRNQE